MTLYHEIAEAITEVTGQRFSVQQHQPQPGGCISQTVRLTDTTRSYFVKLNQADRHDMFIAESEGLQALAASQSVRVPLVICSGVADGSAYLVLEYIAFGGAGADEQALGHQLAQLHRATADRYGWYRNNTIGSTPQINNWGEDWIEFWCQHRLRFQLERAANRAQDNHLLSRGEALLDRAGDFFCDYLPTASLLHGDLWGGNKAYDQHGQPVIFDPAVYYGDRETDLAMTELFGGFSREFYTAYDAAWPLDAGYARRKDLYNLYHILNHFNLFGGGYSTQARGVINRLLAELD